MTLKQYSAFITSVEEGSISKASVKLQITQSGITHLINDFEKELGYKLMVRNKGGIKLTKEGEKVFYAIKNVLTYNEKFIELSNKIKGKFTNKINIATFTSVAVNWLPSIINGFKSKFPEIEITLTDGGYSDIEKALIEGNSDIGFISKPSSERFKFYPLIKDEMLAILPKGHPLSTKSAVPVSAFESENVISLGNNTDHDSRSVFEENNIKPNIKYRTTDDYAMISMVKNNLGICLEPKLLLSGTTSGVEVLSLNPKSYRIIGLAVPYENLDNPLTKCLIEYILYWVKANCENSLV